jgi:deoxyguanosine kinase
MTPTNTVYIALGSNKGNRLQYLQDAINTIFEKIGTVHKISKVYETPAVGFEGEDFYNACIKVETVLKPKKLLKMLKQIESNLGRSTKKSDTYESREIDLDILYYNDDVINEASLLVPHPVHAPTQVCTSTII